MQRLRSCLLAAATALLTTQAAQVHRRAGLLAPRKHPEKVTLRLFSNLPDRKSGQGLAEQMIIDNYMKENPNVKIDVEALAEEPFKNKLKAYIWLPTNPST